MKQRAPRTRPDNFSSRMTFPSLFLSDALPLTGLSYQLEVAVRSTIVLFLVPQVPKRFRCCRAVPGIVIASGVTSKAADGCGPANTRGSSPMSCHSVMFGGIPVPSSFGKRIAHHQGPAVVVVDSFFLWGLTSPGTTHSIPPRPQVF